MNWVKIAIAVAVLAAGWYVYSYISTAEKNADLVVSLKKEKQDLTDANLALQNSYDNKISVLQNSIAQAAEREKTYAKNIEEIQALPDSGCSRNSKPIAASLRLLRAKSGR